MTLKENNQQAPRATKENHCTTTFHTVKVNVGERVHVSHRAGTYVPPHHLLWPKNTLIAHL